MTLNEVPVEEAERLRRHSSGKPLGRGACGGMQQDQNTSNGARAPPGTALRGQTVRREASFSLEAFQILSGFWRRCPVSRLLGDFRLTGVWSKQLAIQLTAGQQNRVANCLDLESTIRKTPPQTVVRIRRRILGIPAFAHPIGVARKNLSMELLDRPPLADEICRQPIEQLGMRGRLAVDTKIAGSPNQPFTKVKLPNSIDDHARRQRTADDPPCQGQAPLRGEGTGIREFRLGGA